MGAGPRVSLEQGKAFIKSRVVPGQTKVDLAVPATEKVFVSVGTRQIIAAPARTVLSLIVFGAYGPRNIPAI